MDRFRVRHWPTGAWPPTGTRRVAGCRAFGPPHRTRPGVAHRLKSRPCRRGRTQPEEPPVFCVTLGRADHLSGGWCAPILCVGVLGTKTTRTAENIPRPVAFPVVAFFPTGLASLRAAGRLRESGHLAGSRQDGLRVYGRWRWVSSLLDP